MEILDHPKKKHRPSLQGGAQDGAEAMVTYGVPPCCPNSYSDSSNDSVSPRQRQKHAVMAIASTPEMIHDKHENSKDRRAWSRRYAQGFLVHSYSSLAPCFPAFLDTPSCPWGLPSSSAVKNPPAMPETQETWVQSLGWEDPLEEGMEIHFSILAWRIPQTEEPGGLQSMGSPRVRHD